MNVVRFVLGLLVALALVGVAQAQQRKPGKAAKPDEAAGAKKAEEQKWAMKKQLRGKKAAAYVYGTLRKTGWKPKRER